MRVLIIIYVNQVKLLSNVLSIGPDVFFLAQPKDSNFELKSPTNMTLSDKWKGRISIWAVNGCQSEGLVIRKFKLDCQGFVVGYDIKIMIPIFFIYN